MTENNCVLQTWVQNLTWKEQSAIMTAVRGSDEFYNPLLRSLVRWLRRSTLYDADLDGTFVKYGDLPTEKDLKPILEYMRVHFVSHLMHGLQIIAYRCPDDKISDTARYYYFKICEMLHCNPETLDQMDARLKDKREKKPVYGEFG